MGIEYKQFGVTLAFGLQYPAWRLLVIGVLKEWTPSPKFYDLNNGSFQDVEDAFIPFRFGPQRFGRDGRNAEIGRAILRGERTPEAGRAARDRFLRRLSISAYQSLLFNRWLAERMADGLFAAALTALSAPFVYYAKAANVGSLPMSRPLAGSQMRTEASRLSAQKRYPPQ